MKRFLTVMCGVAVSSVVASGCQLLVDFDRSRIATDAGPIPDTGVDSPLDAPIDAPIDAPVVDAPIDAPVVDAPVDAACPESCDDDNSCTNDECVDGACTHEAVDNGTECDDGLFCTVNDECTDGTCGGEARDCDLACTSDETCNEDTDSCEVTLDTGCLIDGECVADDAIDPDNECMVCDPGTSTTDYSPALTGTSCDSGFCTDGEQCDGAGTCGGGAPHSCDDSNTCTYDSCDETADECVHVETGEVLSAIGFESDSGDDLFTLTNSDTHSLDLSAFDLCTSNTTGPVSDCVDLPVDAVIDGGDTFSVSGAADPGGSHPGIFYADGLPVITTEGELVLMSGSDVCDYVQWGTDSHDTEDEAVGASQWEAATTVDTTDLDTGESLVVSGGSNGEAANWGVQTPP